MTTPEPTITVAVDVTNPGQFFACCGLLELADRLWPEDGVTGWFESSPRQFCIAAGRTRTLHELLAKAQQTEFLGEVTEDSEEEDEESESDAPFEPLEVAAPYRLLLDWWQDIDLKPWAGSMNARNIAVAMCRAIDSECADPLNQSQVVLEVPAGPHLTKAGKPKPRKPKEPFQLDARRGASALGRDIGFMPDTLKKKYKTPMFAQPAVEFLALVGLQRCRPRPTDRPRVYDYYTWAQPCQVQLLPVVVTGQLGDPLARGYRFENAFRTGQLKHKAYMPASPLLTGDRP